jgi:hypothetical protein
VAYSIERAALIADQLERLATQNLYQLAGQFVNLDFWIAEAAHAIQVLDDYPARFERLRETQREWVRAHGTKVSDYCPICRGACELGSETTPPPPQRIRGEEVTAARRGVRQGGRRYLLRLYRARLLDEDGLRRAAAQLGIDLEDEELAPAER